MPGLNYRQSSFLFLFWEGIIGSQTKEGSRNIIIKFTTAILGFGEVAWIYIFYQECKCTYIEFTNGIPR